MGMLGRVLVFGAVVSVVLLTSFSASGNRSKTAVSIPAFTPAQLTAPAGADWISQSGNIASWRYSALSQINASNGGSLKPAWTNHFAAPTIPEKLSAGNANAVAYNGVLYQQDAWTRIFAVDGASGKTLWAFDPQVGLNVPSNGTNMRSVSIGAGQVFTGAYGTVYGLDAQTGKQNWATQIVDPNAGNGIDAAPVYYKGMVIIGTTGGDWGGSCIVTALDAKTGTVLWYYTTIPNNAKAEGWNTWPTHRSYFGGGAVWDPVLINAAADLVYIGVSNPIPYTGYLNGPGKELNTESVLALHAKTGKFAWLFQEIHHDIWDYDSEQTPTLAYITKGGKKIAVVDHTNKSGYNFILDAVTGKPVVPVHETPVPQSAPMHTYPTQPIPEGDALLDHFPSDPENYQGVIAPDGKPYIVSKSPYVPYTDKEWTVYSPAAGSGVQWQPNSFSPRTGLLYLCINNSDGALQSFPAADIKPVVGQVGQILSVKLGGIATATSTGRLVAVDMATNKIVWKVDTPRQGATITPCSSPVTTTASGLVLIGRNNGMIQAYDDKTGQFRWQVQNLVSGQAIQAAPRLMVYAANGKEYIGAFTNSIFGPELTAYALP